MWVVVGASAGLGRAIAERMAAERRALLLVASDERDLAPLASELRITCGASVRTLAYDAADYTGLAERVEAALAGAPLEGLLFPIGAIDDDDIGTLSPRAVDGLIGINLLSVIAITSRLAPRMAARGRGAIVGFSSIAAIRGRGRNMVYAAAKRALESYFESLRHRYERDGLTVTWYVVGYVATNLTFGRPLPLPAADPARLAARVARELGRAAGRRYMPRGWAVGALLLRALPWAVFRKVEA